MPRPFAMLLVVFAFACNGSRPRLETQPFALHYLGNQRARELVDPYVYHDRVGAPGVVSVTDGALTVRETRDNLERIAAMLAQFDRPHKPIRLTFHLIQADGELRQHGGDALEGVPGLAHRSEEHTSELQ